MEEQLRPVVGYEIVETVARNIAPEMVPRYATPGAAGLDLCSRVRVTIIRHDIVPTGVRVAIPTGYEGQIRPRSGLTRRGVVAMLGTIDSDYRGELCVLLSNFRPEPWTVRLGERIAQLVITPVAHAVLEPRVIRTDETARGAGGFGSTGV